MKTLLLLTIGVSLGAVVVTPARLGKTAEKPAQKDGRQGDLSLPAGLGNVTMLCFPLPEQLPEAMRILLTERNQGEEFLEKPCNASVVCIEIPQELYNELVALGMKGPERLDTGRMGTGQQDTGRQGTEEQGTYVDFYDETDFETYTDHTETETETETPTPTVYYCDYYYDYYNWYEGGPDSWPWKLVEHSEEDVKERFWWNHHHRPQTTSVNTLCNNWQTFLGTIDTTSNTTVTSTFQTFFTSFCNTITRSGVAALGHEVPEDEGRIEARHPPPHPHPHPPSPPPSHSPPPPPPSTSASVKESRILKALRNVMA